MGSTLEAVQDYWPVTLRDGTLSCLQMGNGDVSTWTFSSVKQAEKFSSLFPDYLSKLLFYLKEY